jgi:hypothetical protein
VLVFRAGFSLPLLDRGQTFDCFAFVWHNGILGTALVQGPYHSGSPRRYSERWVLEDRQRYPLRLLAAKKLINGIPAKLDATSIAEALERFHLATM